MKNNLLCVLGAFFFCTLSFGQNPVPNASFESWTDSQPDEWKTSNSPGGNNSNVGPTTPGYSGDYALKGEVKVWPGTPGFPFIPLLESNTSDFGFPLDVAYPALSMFYKFHPVDPDDAFTIYVAVLDENGSSFAGGFAEVTAPADTFTLLNIPITYGPGNPYRAYVSMTVNNYGSTGLPAIGTYFIVDDISMGEVVSSVEDKGRPQATLQRIFPNPANTSLAITFSMVTTEYVTVSLFDLSGRQVSKVFEGELHDGEYTFETSLHELSCGLYFCRLSTPSGTASWKFSVAR